MCPFMYVVCACTILHCSFAEPNSWAEFKAAPPRPIGYARRWDHGKSLDDPVRSLDFDTEFSRFANIQKRFESMEGQRLDFR